MPGQVAEGAALPFFVVGYVAEDVVVESQAPHRLNGIADFVAYGWLANAVEQGGGAARVDPVGQQGVQDGGSSGVGILVKGDVHAGVAALIYQGHHPLAHAVHRVVVVGDVDRDTAAPSDGDSLTEGVEEFVAQRVAGVAHVEATQVGDGLAHRHQFVGVAVCARRVGQAGGEAECAVLHRFTGQLPHPGQFQLSGQAVVPAHCFNTDSCMGSHESHITGDPAIEQIEVFTHGTPAHVRRRSAVDRGEVVQKLLQLIGRGWGIGQSVHAQQFSGDALA